MVDFLFKQMIHVNNCLKRDLIVLLSNSFITCSAVLKIVNLRLSYFTHSRFSSEIVEPTTSREMNFLGWCMFPERRDPVSNIIKRPERKMLWYSNFSADCTLLFKYLFRYLCWKSWINRWEYLQFWQMLPTSSTLTVIITLTIVMLFVKQCASWWILKLVGMCAMCSSLRDLMVLIAVIDMPTEISFSSMWVLNVTTFLIDLISQFLYDANMHLLVSDLLNLTIH